MHSVLTNNKLCRKSFLFINRKQRINIVSRREMDTLKKVFNELFYLLYRLCFLLV